MRHVYAIGAMLGVLLLAAAATAPAEEKPTEMTVDQAFERLKAWDYDQPRAPLHVLERHIATSSGDAAQRRQVAERLAAVAADPQATPAARQFACQHLPLVAGDAQVPVLAKLLDDPKTAETARRALEAVPGDASLAALRAAAERLTGRDLVGAIHALGRRRDAASAGALAKRLADADAEVAAAAAWALGAIGTPDAAAALARATPPAALAAAFRDASLRAAEGLAADGKAAAAEAVYRRLLEGAPPPALRVAALAGLTRVAPDKALPLVFDALAADDPLLRGTGANLLRRMSGAGVTVAVAARLAKVDPAGQVLLVEVLADRADRAAGPAVAALLDAKDEAVRAAAAGALVAVGDAACVPHLARLAAAEGGAVQHAARASLARICGPGVGERLVGLAAEGDPAERVEAIRALGVRRAAGADEALLKSAADADERVRAAALDALALAGGPGAYPKLIDMLRSAGKPGDAAAAERAVLAVGGRLEPPDARVAPVVAALQAGPDAARPALLRVLGGFGGPEALRTVRLYLEESSNPAHYDAAVRALADWPDDGAAPDLLRVAKDAKDATCRVLALRGYLRLARLGAEAAARLKMLDQVRPIATTPEAKRMLLAGLAEVADPGALDVCLAMLDDRDAGAEAAAAALKVAKAVVKADPKAVDAAMTRLLAAARDKAVADEARALQAEARKPSPQEAGAAALRFDQARSDARRKELAGRAPQGYHLVCYLDCGPDAADGAQGKPALRVAAGATHFWPEADSLADARFGSIVYDSTAVVFEASGLAPRRAYQVGLTWWDYDHNTRVQSAWASAGRATAKLLDKTKLPSGRIGGEKPAEVTLPLPRALTAAGTVRLTVRNESEPNAVVSEVWLWESDAESDPPPAAAEPAAQAADPLQRSARKADKRILILTGMEYPGHNWRETAPALRGLIEKDPRIAVDLVEDPEFLGDPHLGDYAAVVLNFMNGDKKVPGPEAREKFRKFVEGGGGLVLVHFACGAFNDWPEFRRMAGRAYDPKLPPHDPHGPLRVEIADADHPITRGMEPFETVDELYTCLAGDGPIHTVASARSKVDGKDYPMAFVLVYGKGRVFHCVLGHDVRALSAAGVMELYRRGTAWAAGLPPVADAK